MRDGNMLRNIRDHFETLANILIEKIGPQLRIEDASSQHDENDDRYDRNDRNKQIGDNEPVSQAPEQSASPPSHKPDDEINACDYRQELQKAENPAVNAKQLNE